MTDLDKDDGRRRSLRPSPVVVIGVLVMFAVLAWIAWIWNELGKRDLMW